MSRQARWDFDAFYLKDKALPPGGGHGVAVHRSASLTLVVGGGLVEEFDGRTLPCPPWSVLYKPTGIHHATRAGERGVRMLIVGLTRRALGEFPLLAVERPVVLPPGAASAALLAAFAAMLDAGTGSAGATADRVPALMERFGERAAAVPRGGPDWLREVEPSLESSGPQPQRVDRLAGRLRLHPVYLARAFRRHRGLQIGELLRRRRVDRAVGELLATRAPLAALAADLGYSDQSHFTREFRRETGLPPGRFRRLARQVGNLQDRAAARR